MTFKYKLQQSDYLDNQLFIASFSDRTNRKRRNSVISVAVFYMGLGMIGFVTHSTIMGVTFMIMSALWYLFYPKYQTKRYYNHYKSFVVENYGEICDSEITIELTEDLIICRGDHVESKIQINSIKDIFELPNVFLVNLNKASNLVVSKTNIHNDINQSQEFINKLNSEHNIEVHNHKNWEWK